MKRSRIVLIPAMAAIALSTQGLRAADDKAAAAAPQKNAAAKEAAPDNGDMMKKMMELAGPGAEHKALEALAGEWNTTARFWMAGSDSEPMESKGTCKRRWLLGGRFLQDEYDGDMMGMKFQGLGITGYDKMKKKYINVWMDSMGTAIMMTEGTADSDNKVFTYTGKMDEPMTGERDKPVKFVTRIISPDKHVFEMYDLNLGDKSKVGEITYTRK
jgi:hypothetical protein